MPFFPLIASLASRLLGWFGAGGIALSFFAWIGKKITVKGLLLPLQFSVVGLLFVHRIALLSLFITVSVYIYNGIVNLLSYINTTIFSSVFATPVQILQSVGFFEALNNVFNTWSFIIISILIMFVSKAILKSIQMMSDEFFKISMMLSV